jgi:WD40 repeat protein
MRRLSLLLFLSCLLFSFHIAAAQDAPVPWCHQPSGVTFDEKTYGTYHYTVRLGNGPEGIRAVYQSYNHRIVLMKSASREVVQVVDENIDTSQFRVLSFSPDCRYLAGVLGRNRDPHTTVIWDLSSNPARRLGESNEFIARASAVDWSPDSAYVIVNTRNGAYLWNLAANQRVRLSPDGHSDCYPSMIGCTGEALNAYYSARWDMSSQRVQLTFLGDIVVTFALPLGEPITFEPSQPIVAQDTKDRLDSPVGCKVRVQYQAYNQRLVLADRNSRKLLRVVEDHFQTDYFSFMGWSANCHYIAAAVGTKGHTDTVIWDVAGNQRIATFKDAVGNTHRLRWSSFGPYALIETRHGAYLWDVTTDNRVLLTDRVDAKGRSFEYWIHWYPAQNALLVEPAGQEDTYSIYQVPGGALLAQGSWKEVCAAQSWLCAD